MECKPRKQFTVTKGTLLEGSHLPLRTWVYVIASMCNGKKGVASRQLQRELKEMAADGSYGNFQSLWHATHRVRHAMADTSVSGLLGGEGKVLECDETWVGGKPRNPKPGNHYMKMDNKVPVVALVERGGGVRSAVLNEVNAHTLRNHLAKHGDRASRLMTDEHQSYKWPGKLFNSHESVNHKRREYARGDVFSNTVESYFSLVKRSVYGTHHHYSVRLMPYYLNERDFTWTHRDMSDTDKVRLLFTKMVGKRLYYKTPKNASCIEAGRNSLLSSGSQAETPQAG